MAKNLIFVLTIALFSKTAFTADYCFPSSNPPYGKSPSEVKQYISIIWDDNGYSGKNFTQYEDEPGGSYQNSSWVGGKVSEGGSSYSKPNDLNIQEGDMGMSWAGKTLAGVRPPEAPDWSPTEGYSAGLKVIYNDTVWVALPIAHQAQNLKFTQELNGKSIGM